MRFFVRAHGKFRNVTTQSILGKLQANLRAASTPFLPVEQFEVLYVGNEVRLPRSTRIPGASVAKIVCLRVETIRKNVVAIEYEIRVMKQIDHAECTCGCEITGRFAAV